MSQSLRGFAGESGRDAFGLTAPLIGAAETRANFRRALTAQIIELMIDQETYEVAQAIMIQDSIARVGYARGIRISEVEFGAAKINPGFSIVAQEPVEPMMRMVEGAAKIEQQTPRRIGHPVSLAVTPLCLYNVNFEECAGDKVTNRLCRSAAGCDKPRGQRVDSHARLV